MNEDRQSETEPSNSVSHMVLNSRDLNPKSELTWEKVSLPSLQGFDHIPLGQCKMVLGVICNAWVLCFETWSHSNVYHVAVAGLFLTRGKVDICLERNVR